MEKLWLREQDATQLGLGIGTSGWERVVNGNPCKHLALSEGMRGVGVTH